MTPDDLNSVLFSMKTRYAELEKQLADPQIYADRFRCRALTRERGHLEDFFRTYDNWTRALRESAENREMLQTEQDETLRQLIESEQGILNGKIAKAENSIGSMLLPPDPNDSRSAIVEIRPAAGGEEAALFAGTMFRLMQNMRNTGAGNMNCWIFPKANSAESRKLLSRCPATMCFPA